MVIYVARFHVSFGIVYRCMCRFSSLSCYLLGKSTFSVNHMFSLFHIYVLFLLFSILVSWTDFWSICSSSLSLIVVFFAKRFFIFFCFLFRCDVCIHSLRCRTWCNLWHNQVHLCCHQYRRTLQYVLWNFHVRVSRHLRLSSPYLEGP